MARQVVKPEQRLWESAASKVLVAAHDGCGSVHSVEVLAKHLKMIPGWIRKAVAWRQQEVELLEGIQKEQLGGFDPVAPSPADVLAERQVMKVKFHIYCRVAWNES